MPWFDDGFRPKEYEKKAAVLELKSIPDHNPMAFYASRVIEDRKRRDKFIADWPNKATPIDTSGTMSSKAYEKTIAKLDADMRDAYGDLKRHGEMSNGIQARRNFLDLILDSYEEDDDEVL